MATMTAAQRRDEAREAYNAYLASKPGAGDLVPRTPPTSVPV